MQELWTGLWDHVEDLRRTFLKSAIVIGAAFILLLVFYQPLFHFLTSIPFDSTRQGLAVQAIHRFQIVNHSFKDEIFEVPPHSSVSSEYLPLMEKEKMNAYKLAPGQILSYETTSPHSPLLIMGPIEGIGLVMKVCFWLSLALSAPLWGWFWLQFILPGLRGGERAIMVPFTLISLLCIGLGIGFAYYVTLPAANQSLLYFNHSIGQNAWTLSNYVDYVLLLCIGHAIAAEMGLLLFFLVHLGILTPEWLIAKRRYMIVLIFVMGALLTPPDVFTQLLLALPLIGLYEAAIGYAKWVNRHLA